MRITNRGGTAGMVERVDVVRAGWFRSDEFTPVPSVVGGTWRNRKVFPFTLPEGALASLILMPKDAEQFPPGIGVFIRLGHGLGLHDSRESCRLGSD